MDANTITHSEAAGNNSQNSIVCDIPHEDGNISEPPAVALQLTLDPSTPNSPASSAPSSPVADSAVSVSPSKSVFSDFDTEPTPETRHQLTYSPTFLPMTVNFYDDYESTSLDGSDTEWAESDGDEESVQWSLVHEEFDSDEAPRYWSDDPAYFEELMEQIAYAKANGGVVRYSGPILPEFFYW